MQAISDKNSKNNNLPFSKNIFKGWSVHHLVRLNELENGRFKIPIFTPHLDIN